MEADQLIRRCRREAGLTLRQLAELAGTSHATLSAYEHGRVVPGVDTIARIVDAAGFALDIEPVPRCRAGVAGPGTKGDELYAVLELASRFPARHDRELGYPLFGRATGRG